MWKTVRASSALVSTERDAGNGGDDDDVDGWSSAKKEEDGREKRERGREGGSRITDNQEQSPYSRDCGREGEGRKENFLPVFVRSRDRGKKRKGKEVKYREETAEATLNASIRPVLVTILTRLFPQPFLNLTKLEIKFHSNLFHGLLVLLGVRWHWGRLVLRTREWPSKYMRTVHEDHSNFISTTEDLLVQIIRFLLL